MSNLFAAAGLFSLLGGSMLCGQTPVISQVVDAASFKTELAPGSLANLTGSNFGTSTAIPVTAGGKACAVLSASPTQLQIQIAVDAPAGPAAIQVGTSAPFNISLAGYAPAIYSADGSGKGDARAFHADGSPVTIWRPAEAQEIIFIFATGMGPTVPVVPTGTVSPANPIAMMATALTMTIANQPATILFAGLAPGKIGIYQINFLVPAGIVTGDQPISFDAGGVTSNSLTLPTSDAPVITGLKNNYSYITAGFPDYGIAQGSIFIITGNNLAGGGSSGPLQYPLQTSLDGVSVQVSVNGATTQAILYYVTPAQVGAILPSGTPVGLGQITVTKSGQTGPSAPIQVVQSAFGLLTLNQTGSGPAAALDANFRYLGLTNSVQPGEYVNFFGSGLGPAEGDEADLQTPLDLGNIPIEVDIGGLPATVTYHGRSIYPGLDQVQVIVPQGVPPGCNVSVVVRTGNIYSNYASIPVAISARTCAEPELGVSSDLLQSLAARPLIRVGTIDIEKDLNIEKNFNAAQDRASAQFTAFATAQFGPVNLGKVSAGSCTVSYDSVFNNGSDALDAGPAINISSPAGAATLNPSGDDDGNYGESPASGATFPGFIPAGGGTLNFDNGVGGSDVGAFTSNLGLGPPLVWINQAGFNTVNRSGGATITWTGGAANSYVQISGRSAAGAGSLEVLNANFTCSAPVAAGQFTIPPAVLLALPPGSDGPPFGTLSVSNITAQSFIAPGLDLGLVSTSVNFINATVTYR